jgi:hypothetical protein
MEVKKFDPVQTGIIGVNSSMTVQQVFVPSVLSVSSVSASSAVFSIASVTSAAGQMGPNGQLLIEVYGQITNVSGSTRNLIVSGSTPSTHSITSQNYASGNSGGFYYRTALWNNNDEAINYNNDYLLLARTNFAIDVSMSTYGAVGIDTSVDTYWDVQFQLSGTGSTSYLVFLVRASTSYGAGF